jgi:hypothetical protein
VAEGSARFNLDDGETLTLAQGDLYQIYELLWQLAPKRGAVSTAAVIRGAVRSGTFGSPIELDVSQSVAMREAMVLLHDSERESQVGPGG